VASGLATVVTCHRARNRGSKTSRPWSQERELVRDDKALHTPWGLIRPVDVIGMWAHRHMHEFGTKREHFGNVAVAARKHAQNNPFAMMRGRPLDMETYLAGRVIGYPLTLYDSGSAEGRSWSGPALDTESWKTMTLPTLWEDAGEPDLNGVVWFRKTFVVPPGAAGAPAEVQLALSTTSTPPGSTAKVGTTAGYNLVRMISFPRPGLVATSSPWRARHRGGGGIWAIAAASSPSRERLSRHHQPRGLVAISN
jgi:hypothetical protein